MNVSLKIRSLINKRRKVNQKPDVTYTVIGSNATITMKLPFGHKLPEFQRQFKGYDRKLPQIAKTIYAVKSGICIDVGANVGDTALLIRTVTDMPVICIEGDDEYFSYLEANVQNIGSISVMHCYVGGKTGSIKGSFEKVGGTGRILHDGSGSVSVLSLDDIISIKQIKYTDVTLLKTDTDGFDFDIIIGSIDFIKRSKPALFFEYEIGDAESEAKSLGLVTTLSEIGYRFIAYDNYGNYMSLIDADCVKRFKDLNTYIKTSASNGGGIVYADILASADSEILQLIYKQEVV